MTGSQTAGELRVLVLEDEEGLRDLLTEMLQTAGYAVIGCASGPEALQRLADVSPSVVISDVVMPEMDGLEFVSRLRAIPSSAHIPVLLISGLAEGVSDTIDMGGAGQLGVAAVLPKPVEFTTLIEHVRRVTARIPAGKGE